MKSKILKETEGRIELTIRTWKELEQLMKRKDIDFCEFCLAYEYLQQASPQIKGEPDFPPLEMLYRKLGLNSEFSNEVLKDMAEESNRRGPPNTEETSAEGIKKLAHGLNGWAERDKMVATIKRHVDLENSNKFATELGKAFQDDLLYGLSELVAKWERKTEDVPFTYNAPMGFNPYPGVALTNRQRKIRPQIPRDEDQFNFEFRALLQLMAGQAFDTATRLASTPYYEHSIVGIPIHVGFAPPERMQDQHPMYSRDTIKRTEDVRKFTEKMKAMDKMYKALPPGTMAKLREVLKNQTKKKR